MIDRFEVERQVGRALSREMQAELEKLMEYLGDPPELNNVPPAYWRNGWKQIQNKVEPILVGAFVQSALDVADGIGIGVDWDLVNTDAANWARNNLAKTLERMFQRTYEGVGELVPRYFEEQWGRADLAQRLERYYSPVRAEMIAVTETTRAVVEGERAAVDRLAEITGERMIPVWLTMNDERVCPICGPRHKQMITDGMYPPAHPRCRCEVAYQYPKKEA